MKKNGFKIEDLSCRWLELVDLTAEMAAVKKTVRRTRGGTSVDNKCIALKSFAKVKNAARGIFDLDSTTSRDPRIVLTSQMKLVIRETLRLYVLFFPLASILMYMTFHVTENGDLGVWIVRILIFFLFLFPLIHRRRLRFNISHDCRYRRNETQDASIEIDQLPEKQFESYLAHEYAHHVYYDNFSDLHESWIKEGWCRLFQWEVVRNLHFKYDDPSYLEHALEQILSELKCACEMAAMKLHVYLPSFIRKIKNPYSTNSLFSFITGKPGYDAYSHMMHSIGTARFFLASKKRGSDEVLKNPWIAVPEGERRLERQGF